MEELTEGENKVYLKLLMGHSITKEEILAELGEEGVKDFLKKIPLFIDEIDKKEFAPEI